MKQLIVAVSVCALLVVGCSKEDEREKEVAQLKNEMSALQDRLDEKQRQLDEMMASVNEVHSNLEAIHSKETRFIERADQSGGAFKGDRLAEMKEIDEALKENRTKIKSLESKVKSYKGGIAELHGQMRTLQQSLREREQALSQVKSRVREPNEKPMSEVQFTMEQERLVKALASSDQREQASAAKRVRDLQKLYPDRSYDMLIIPLMRIVKDDDGYKAARTHAAYALHGIHSERGDFAIKGMSDHSTDREFRRLCTRLTFQREEQDDLARLEREKGEATLTTR